MHTFINYEKGNGLLNIRLLLRPGLSGGAVIGIAVGVSFFVILLIVLVMFVLYLRSRRAPRREKGEKMTLIVAISGVRLTNARVSCTSLVLVSLQVCFQQYCSFFKSVCS